MGGAMLTGWLAQGLDPARVVVIEPQPSPDISALATQGITLNPTSVRTADTLVVAVKPQMFREAGARLKSMVGDTTLVVSIMAGGGRPPFQEVCGGGPGPGSPAPPRPA